MPPADATRLGLGRRMRTAVTEHLALKIAALFFSCVLWLVVSAEEPTEQVVPLVVAPRLDSSLVLVGRRPVVRALVVGRARELLELAADPPVARPFVSLARAFVHSGDSVEVTVAPGDVEIPTNVQVLVREIRPRAVMIQVARVTHPPPPPTQAESALAGLVTPDMKVDTGRAVRDTVGLDTLLLPDSPRVLDSTRLDSMRRATPRRDTTPRARRTP